MSRSYKKNPIVKDSNNKFGKSLANKRYRKIVKESIKKEKNIPQLKEVFNTYDVIDYVIRGFKHPKSNSCKKMKRK